MAALEGREIGRYHLVEQIGQGGMATVYKAYDTRLERTVAIKIIRTTAFPVDIIDQVLKRFEREAKALAKLSHPNIVKVYDYGEYENAPYLVMEFLKGGTLKNRFEGPVPWAEATRLLTPIARALAYAHQLNILHRDVKPGNILITESGEPMLSDFGIAKILDAGDGQTLTGAGVGIGTPEYMAPEQAVGQSSPKSDIYALGVVLYELVTGHRPFTADTPMAVLIKHMTDPLPLPGIYVPELPEAVEMAMVKALAKEPEERYATMSDFATTMDRLTSGAVTEAAFRIDKSQLPEALAAQESVAAIEEKPAPEQPVEATRVMPGKPAQQPAAEAEMPVIDEKTRTAIDMEDQATELASKQVSQPVSPAPAIPAPPATKAAPPAPASSAQKKKGFPWLAVGGVIVLIALIAVGVIFLPGLLAKPTPVALPPATLTPVPTIAVRPTLVPTEPIRAVAPTPLPRVITVWHNFNPEFNPEKAKSYRKMLDIYQKNHPGVKIEMLFVPQLADAVQKAIPAGKGPDLVIGFPHNDIGSFAKNEMIVSLNGLGIDPVSLFATYIQDAGKAVTWQQRIWALPISVEAIALIFNRDLVTEEFLPSDPNDFGALLDKARAFYRKTGKPLICNQGFGGGDAYHVAPVYFGFGAPGYINNDGEVFANTPPMLAAGEWLAALRKVSLPDNSFDICLNHFREGQVGMWWTGPWSLPLLDEKAIHFAIAPMGRPFISVTTIMVTRNALERKQADVAADLAVWLAGIDAQRELFQANYTIPVIASLLNSPEFMAMGSQEAFFEFSRRGILMPNAPFSAEMWGPMAEATGQIWSGTLSPKEALGRAQLKILEALGK